MAAFLIPALARWLLPEGSERGRDPASHRVEAAVGCLLPHSALVAALSALLVAGAVAWLGGLGTELLPPADPRQFSVRLVGSPGLKVESMAEIVATVEEMLSEAAGEDLEAVFSEVGEASRGRSLIREEQNEENTARIRVRLAAGGRSGREVAVRARSPVATLARLEASWQVGTSALARAVGRTGPPIVVEISGRSLPDLRGGAETVAEGLRSRGELWNVRSSFEGGPPELHVVLDRTSPTASVWI